MVLQVKLESNKVMLLLKLDGKDITTYKSFLTALYSHKAGDKVKVVVNRSGTEKTIEVTLQEK